jgi:hypothetical protein
MSRRSPSAPVRIETTAAIPFVTHGSTDTPAAPDGTPTYVIRDAAGLGTGTNLLTGSATAVSGETTVFFLPPAMTTTNGFAAGETYYAIVSYAIGAVAMRDAIDIPVV